MKMSLVAVISLGMMAAMMAGWSFAQRPQSAASHPTGVALVDIGAVTRSSTRVKQSIDVLKKEYEDNAAALRKEGEQGNAMTEQMRKMPPGPQRKKMEEDLVKRRADFELRGKKATNMAAEGEAKVYAALAQEIKEELARYAAATGAKLILRYEPSPTEFPNRQAVATEIQRLVVYQRDGEISPALSDAINRRGGTSRAPAQNRTAPR